MTTYRKVAKLSEIPERSARCVEVDGKRIALFNLGGTVYAIADTCTHALASLSEGEISGDEIICPLHAATFEIRTGRVTSPPAAADLQTWPVRITGEDVEIEVE